MESDRIVKITIEYQLQGKLYKAIYENPIGITKLELPLFPDKAILSLWDNNEKKASIRFNSFCSLKLGDASLLSDDEKETAEILLDGLNYNFIIDEIFVSEAKIPSVNYVDATEQILLKFPTLSTEIIDGTDTGLWSHSGERVIVINVKNFPFKEEKVNCKLEFTDYDDCQTFDPKPSAKIKRKDTNTFICSLNTDDFNVYMSPEKSKVRMKGFFRISNEPKSGDTSVTFEFPVSLNMNNSMYFESKNKYLCVDRNSKVSIDFGTSSTCVAIKSNIISMIEMSLDVDGASVYSVYENPTNLMIYRWSELSEKWNFVECQPLMRRHLADYPEYSPELFDFGHTVKGMEIDNQRCLDSIINQLKMIPQLIEDGKKIKIRDYENSDEIELSYELSDDNVFNPIEFYGYLLGKAINHPNGNGNRYYTKYLLSYPVKFSDKIRRIIEKSLTAGILRSLPQPVRTLKDEKGRSLFQVKMKYSEPIACIGATCGEELLLEDEKPCLFGIFDFGGGTADYSFGMYRSADIDTEGYDEALELFGVDGDESFGGEVIISKISYWILTDKGNKSVVISNGITFEKPKDELVEDGYGNLLLSTIGAVANIRKLNELISRPFFEGKVLNLNLEDLDVVAKEDTETDRYVYDGTTVAQDVDLFSVSSENEKVTVNLKIDFDMLNKKLEELFQEKCQAFSQSMDIAFSLPESEKKMAQAGVSYDKSLVKILMAGNSSRHPLIRDCLKKVLGIDNISLIGENRTDIGKNRYKVTPKTAVSIGTLKLEQMLVNEPKVISIIYVATEIKSKLSIILNGDLGDTTWKRTGVINDGLFTIYTSTTPSIENRLLWKNNDLEFDDNDDERLVCYIRQTERDEIEYIAVPIGVNPNEDDSEFEIMKKKIN